MNALNGVWSDTYILQTIIQEELQNLIKILRKDLILKTEFPVKSRDIHKLEKKNSIGVSVFRYENKEKYSIYVSNKCCEEKHVDLLFIGEGEKETLCSNQ